MAQQTLLVRLSLPAGPQTQRGRASERSYRRESDRGELVSPRALACSGVALGDVEGPETALAGSMSWSCPPATLDATANPRATWTGSTTVGTATTQLWGLRGIRTD